MAKPDAFIPRGKRKAVLMAGESIGSISPNFFIFRVSEPTGLSA